MTSDPAPRRRARQAWPLTALGIVALVTTACGGITDESTPAIVAPDAVPAELSEVTTTTAVAADAALAEVYLVFVNEQGEERLPSCLIFVDAGDGTEAQALANVESLIRLVPAEDPNCNSRFTNAIPPDLELLDVTLDDGVLVVDLGNLGQLSEGPAQRRAIAQIVFTATRLSGVSGVRFQQDGEDTAISVEGRSVDAGQAISRADFPSFDTAPSTTTTTTTTPPPPPPDPGQPEG